MQQIVLPIKDSNVLTEVQDTLLHNFRAGRRNYTIFQVGKATLLRVSDVMRLRWADVFMEPCVRMRLYTTKKPVKLICST
ncbi:hypothetical protein LFE01_18940 [Limosilactobacillus fermentum]|nr:hypothetical protein LFE01_18940 [Limosilactobacillus fermentum]